MISPVLIAKDANRPGDEPENLIHPEIQLYCEIYEDCTCRYHRHWQLHEDIILLTELKKIGWDNHMWTQIATRIPPRTASTARYRYKKISCYLEKYYRDKLLSEQGRVCEYLKRLREVMIERRKEKQEEIDQIRNEIDKQLNIVRGLKLRHSEIKAERSALLKSSNITTPQRQFETNKCLIKDPLLSYPPANSTRKPNSAPTNKTMNRPPVVKPFVIPFKIQSTNEHKYLQIEDDDQKKNYQPSIFYQSQSSSSKQETQRQFDGEDDLQTKKLWQPRTKYSTKRNDDCSSQTCRSDEKERKIRKISSEWQMKAKKGNPSQPRPQVNDLEQRVQGEGRGLLASFPTFQEYRSMRRLRLTPQATRQNKS